MPTITIPKKEYEELVQKSRRYEYLRQIVAEDIFSPPPIKNTKGIIAEFEATKRYNKHFLQSLESGLRRSSYFHV